MGPGRGGLSGGSRRHGAASTGHPRYGVSAEGVGGASADPARGHPLVRGDRPGAGSAGGRTGGGAGLRQQPAGAGDSLPPGGAGGWWPGRLSLGNRAEAGAAGARAAEACLILTEVHLLALARELGAVTVPGISETEQKKLASYLPDPSAEDLAS